MFKCSKCKREFMAHFMSCCRAFYGEVICEECDCAISREALRLYCTCCEGETECVCGCDCCMAG